ncbi:hypothetical protein [Pseudosulfitobacter pseudonitzschiae]|nr:hypothetical protein [Pseudosulfitobacter pseudonitzschiae]
MFFAGWKVSGDALGFSMMDALQSDQWDESLRELMQARDDATKG